MGFGVFTFSTAFLFQTSPWEVAFLSQALGKYYGLALEPLKQAAEVRGSLMWILSIRADDYDDQHPSGPVSNPAYWLVV